MRQEKSFGVIPLCRKGGSWHVFLIQHLGRGYWGFPKGHAESHETAQESAFRELKEETNLECVSLLHEEPVVEQYRFFIGSERILKTVFYFVAEVAGEVKLQVEEISNGMWLPISAAMEQLTYPEGKEILSQVAKILPNL
jgi:bis(5'-nucleosidyl)-tetraphosphatase